MHYREIDNLFLYELLKNFALSLIGIFIPVYIVSQGEGLLAAAMFIAISGLIGLTLSYPVSLLISRIGFKHALITSYIFLIPGLAVIKYFELSITVIIVSSLLYNLGRLLHNIGMNSEFAVDSEQDKRDDDAGKMLSLPSISRIIAPFLGGAIFAGLGFGELMLFTLLVLATSAVPLLFSRDHRDPMDHSFEDLLKEEYLKTVPLFISRGIQAVTAVSIYGLFVYMIIGGSLDVGAARALDSLGFVLTGLGVGKYAGKITRQKLVLAGCLGASTIFLLRGLVQTPLQVFMVSFTGGIFFQIYHVPIYSTFADEAESTEVLEFYTLRKMFTSVGNLLTVGTLITFYSIYSLRTAFTASFVLASLATAVMAITYLKAS